jgi:hypothetical protein
MPLHDAMDGSHLPCGRPALNVSIEPQIGMLRQGEMSAFSSSGRAVNGDGQTRGVRSGSSRAVEAFAKPSGAPSEADMNIGVMLAFTLTLDRHHDWEGRLHKAVQTGRRL